MNFNANGCVVQPMDRTLGMPGEGPKLIPLNLDFTQNSTYTVDLSSLMTRNFISMIQSLYADNLDNTQPMTIQIDKSQQRMEIDAGDQCYRPVLVPNPALMTFSCPGGAANVTVLLLNFPVAWGDNARGPQGALWVQYGPYTTTDTVTVVPGTFIDLVAAGWTGLRFSVSVVNTGANIADIASETWSRLDQTDMIPSLVGGALAPGAVLNPSNPLIGSLGRFFHLTAVSDTPGSPTTIQGAIYAV